MRLKLFLSASPLSPAWATSSFQSSERKLSALPPPPTNDSGSGGSGADSIIAESNGDYDKYVPFLDDFEPNLAAARTAGLRTIHVTDPGPAIAELDLLLGEDARP